ncbi:MULTISPECIES: pyrroloquinoline-quinone synthase PqqC [Streptomyces]|uniref:Pyrroloquinoline-quinone synthase n=3 Tax=Streptomyces TaxID=1883 RepID=A0A7H1QCT2_9ACTN|nr:MULTISPECIES: pyrroloquinoline-quinone synthase PqqC [Streptomyces]ADN64222.1 LkcL [Streptomyces rochei subsp. volubilis]MBA9050710.1 pyrroloquinoline-quinone synthase [Streptomyces murinus]QNT98112.1 pyrroloquinoline quinone biosynthesis protein C [Streptomyces griseofuscus]BAC76465.1 pyrroloquinoline quinone biosynthesis protein C [Streptomyces rochei]
MSMSVTREVAAPWSEAEFRQRLHALESSYWDRHPFHRRMHEGLLDEGELRLWAANRWYYQRCLPQKDAAIVANCPLPEVRRQWLSRIVYHDGADACAGGAEKWLRLAEAVGLRRDEVHDERLVLAGTRFAVDAYVDFARRRPWLEAAASGLTELFSPGLLAHRLGRLREHYPWIAEEGFEYFTARIEVVGPEGRSLLDLVARHAVSREQQEACVRALAFKCRVLNAVLDSLDYHTGNGATRS